MKLKINYFILLTLFLLTLSSCEIEGCTDPIAVNYNPSATVDDGSCLYEEMWTEEVIDGVTYFVLNSHIDADIVLGSDEHWMISGPTFVDAGATLTILPGTTIYADVDAISYLSVGVGAVIEACGAADDPIIFTPLTDAPEPGAWGGLVLNGDAPHNQPYPAFGEGGTGAYGGLDAGGSSGSLCYVRVEYGGKHIGESNSLNGFTFYACGSRTTLDHLQAYKCADDGFEFYGGTVSLRYAVATACQDDGFDWQNGWVGKGQFWVTENGSEINHRGIEGYNIHLVEDDILPISNPILANLSIISLSDDLNETGIYLSYNTNVRIMNALVHGFGRAGVRVVCESTAENMEEGSLLLTNSIIDNITSTEYLDRYYTPIFPSITIEDPANDNAIATDGALVGFLSGIVGSTTTGAGDPTILDPWFVPAPYIGAIQAGDDWTFGWTLHL